MKIVYMGTGEIGLPALSFLIAGENHRLTGVFTQPDKKVGRRQILTPPAIKTLAREHGIPVFQPSSISDPAALEQLSALAPDLAIVMAYGQILPPAVIEAPALATLNLHASLLPKFRGAAPIQAAIREGETESGLTVIFIDEGLDTGDILLSKKIPLARGETGGSLHDRLASLAPGVIEETLRAFEGGAPPRTPQDGSFATSSPKLGREDGRLDWARPAELLERTIRAYDPWPGTTTRWSPAGANPANLKIFPPVAIIAGHAEAPCGTVTAATDEGIEVATGSGVLRFSELQPEGRRRMAAAEFLRGASLAPGDRFC